MAAKNMTLVAKSDPAGKGALFHEAFSAITADSDPVILPVQDITGIAASLTGTGTIDFTIDPPDLITAGTAVYVAWDGSSAINPAVTGFFINVTSGAVSAKVTVRTRE